MALALNKTVKELEEQLTEEEFLDWMLYNSIHLLPQKRNEYYLAQLTLQVVAAAGQRASLSDFLFDDVLLRFKESKSMDAEKGAEIIGAMTGKRKIVKIGQKRKKHG